MVGETAGVWGLVVYGPFVGKETARGRELRWWEEPRRHEAPGSLFFFKKKKAARISCGLTGLKA